MTSRPEHINISFAHASPWWKCSAVLLLVFCTARRTIQTPAGSAIAPQSFAAPQGAPSAKSVAHEEQVAPGPIQLSGQHPPVITGAHYPVAMARADMSCGPWLREEQCGCGRRHGRANGAGAGEEFRFQATSVMHDPNEQWAPDGIARPWPYDEYVWDGGDRNRDLRVDQQARVYGMDPEDTFVQYDTIQGKREVSASNRVPIYSPRFASVRHVVYIEENEKTDRVAVGDSPVELGLTANRDTITNLNQPLPVVNHLGVGKTQSFHERSPGLTMQSSRNIAMAHTELLPYEQFRIMSQGVMDAGEKPRLSQAILNAQVWTDTKSVQVVIDGKLPSEAVNNEKLGEAILYDRHGKPQIRIVKIADKSEAKPGETVSFTLRYDDIGNDIVENVVIIDNLTVRLEYVEKSQTCEAPHEFITTPNDAETLVLRWELAEPLKPGTGGLIRFQCRLR